MLKKWLPDVLLMAGAVVLSYGMWLAYAPLGFIVAGALSIYAGYVLTRAE
jgi:hypothetical protein